MVCLPVPPWMDLHVAGRGSAAAVSLQLSPVHCWVKVSVLFLATVALQTPEYVSRVSGCSCRGLQVEELFENSRESAAKIISMKRTEADPAALASLQRSHQALKRKNRLVARVFEFIRTCPGER